MGLAAQSSKRRLKSPGIINDLAGSCAGFFVFILPTMQHQITPPPQLEPTDSFA